MNKKKLLFKILLIIAILAIIYFAIIPIIPTKWQKVKIIEKWNEGFFNYILIEKENGQKERIEISMFYHGEIEIGKTYNIKTLGFNTNKSQKILFKLEEIDND